MRIIHWIGRAAERLVIGGLVSTVALVSGAIDASIGLIGRLSERLDARMLELARESDARRRQEGRRRIDPLTLN